LTAVFLTARPGPQTGSDSSSRSVLLKAGDGGTSKNTVCDDSLKGSAKAYATREHQLEQPPEQGTPSPRTGDSVKFGHRRGRKPEDERLESGAQPGTETLQRRPTQFKSVILGVSGLRGKRINTNGSGQMCGNFKQKMSEKKGINVFQNKKRWIERAREGETKRLL